MAAPAPRLLSQPGARVLLLPSYPGGGGSGFGAAVDVPAKCCLGRHAEGRNRRCSWGGRHGILMQVWGGEGREGAGAGGTSPHPPLGEAPAVGMPGASGGRGPGSGAPPVLVPTPCWSWFRSSSAPGPRGGVRDVEATVWCVCGWLLLLSACWEMPGAGGGVEKVYRGLWWVAVATGSGACPVVLYCRAWHPCVVRDVGGEA